MARIISSLEYAENVEDIITGAVEGAIASAFDFIAKTYGFCTDYDERERRAFAICDNLQASGLIPKVRDEVIAQFEKNGMDVVPDGREF